MIDGAVMARGNIHLSLAVEGDGRGVHHLDYEGLDVVIGVDLEDRDRDFLAARTGEGDVEIAFGVERRIGNGVKVLRDGHRDFNGMRIADVAVGRDHDGAGGRSFGYARDQKRVGADHNGSLDLAELHFRATQLRRPQAGAGDANLRPR